jgi:phosphoserine phosphatase RsbU/P
MDQFSSNSTLVVELEQQRELLRKQQELDARVLSALYAISLACRDHPTYAEIFQVIYHELSRVFDFDATYIALCDNETDDTFRAVLTVDEGVQEYSENDSYSTLTGRIVRNGETLLFRDLQAEWYGQNPAHTPTMFGSQKRSRSWLGVPLMIGSDSVGVISIQSYTVGVFDQAASNLLQRMSNVIAVALENVRLLERQQQLTSAMSARVVERTEELAALSELAAALVLRRPLQEFLDRAIAITLDLFKMPSGNVRLLDESREHLVLHAAQGFSAAYMIATGRSRLATSPIRSVVFERTPQVVNHNWYTLRQSGNFPIDVFPRFEASISVPLVVGEHVLGTMTLFDMFAREFDAHAIDLAQVVANQIAVVVENMRLFEEHERQIAELRALSRISLAASTAHDARTLLNQVHDALIEALPIDVFTMVVYDSERGVITDGLSIDEGQCYNHWGSQSPPAGSLTAWIIGHRQPLRFNNLPEEINQHSELQHYIVGSGRNALSWLGVPTLDRDGLPIGMIAVQSYTAGRYSRRDEDFMRNVAAQVALHVQNVRLLTQRERQIRELDVIGQVGQLVTASYDLDEILAGVYSTLQALTEASVFFLLLCEPDSRLITHAMFVEEGEPINLQVEGGRVQEGSLSDWILTNREPLLFTDLVEQRKSLASRAILPMAVGPANPVRSWAGVPLVARSGELIGVLSLQDYAPYRYDALTIDFLSQVASHVSLGVQKIRLFAERQGQVALNARLAEEARAHAESAERQAQRMQLVHRISSLLSARLHEGEIVEIAARELVQLFWADHTGTVLFDDELAWGTVVSEYPLGSAVGIQVPLADNPLLEELIRTRQPILISDALHDPRAITSRETFQTLGITSLAIVPLVSRDKLIGSISLDSYGPPRMYTSAEQELMMTVATSIATALENARLFAAEQEARRTADTLREIARVIGSSFDPAEVLRLILGELRKVVTYDTASIMLLDGDLLRIAAAQGWDIEQDPVGVAYPVAGSGAGMVAHSGRPFSYSDLQTAASWVQQGAEAHVQAWMGVPLKTRGRVLGVLNIDSRTVRRFSDRDVEVATTFANHAAVALENAQLYQESVTRVEQELEIAQRIQRNLFPRSLSVPEGMVVAATCLPARETGGDFYDVLDLGDGRVGVIVGDVSGKSIPAAMLMAVARSAARSEARNHEVPAVVLVETNRWLVEDVPPNTFVALGYAVLDIRTNRLAHASGGQLAPLHRRIDGSVSYLEAPGLALPLGIVRNVPYQQLETAIAPGDTLVYYTDGIVEAQNRQRQLFGFERLEALVRDYGDMSPDNLINLILAAVHAFAGDMPQHDDMTLVVVRVNSDE